MRRAVACGLALTLALALLLSGRGSFHTGGPESYFPLWEELFDTSFAERLVTRGRCAGLSNACFLMPSVVLETAGRHQLCQGVFT